MSQTLEQRVDELEQRVTDMNERLIGSAVRKKDPFKTCGIFKDDPHFEEAVRLGSEWRQAQTYENEIAGS